MKNEDYLYKLMAFDGFHPSGRQDEIEQRLLTEAAFRLVQYSAPLPDVLLMASAGAAQCRLSARNGEVPIRGDIG